MYLEIPALPCALLVRTFRSLPGRWIGSHRTAGVTIP
jgi:hypothetical protein